MAGPVTINEGNIKALSDIAKTNNAGQWIDPKTKKYIPTRKVKLPDGTIVTRPAGNYGRAYSNRQRHNLVKANMRKRDMSESEAREFINEQFEEMERAINEGRDQDEIIEIRKKLRGS